MDLKIKNKVCIITGGAKGIGYGIAKLWASEGGIPVIFSRSMPKEHDKELKKLSSEYEFYEIDLKNYEQIEKLVKKVAIKHGGIYALVNNAGITKDTLIMRMKEEDFDNVIDVNLKGTFNCAKHASAIMLKQRFGKIINMTSVVGIAGNAGQVNYAASKAGVIGLTKSLAKELGSRGITVNAVAPGFINTDMTASLSEKVKEEASKNIPLKRLGDPEDVANLVGFLASDAANYITGQVINVDGGMVM